MRNHIGRIGKLEVEIKEKSLGSGEQEYSGLREVLNKLNPERSRVIDGSRLTINRLFKQFKDSPELAVQQALRHIDTETIKQIINILWKKREVSFQATSS